MRYLFIVFNLIAVSGFSQNPLQENQKAIVAEIGKNGLVFNLLYDHYFFKSHFGFHIGGGTTIFNQKFELRTATAGFYFLIGKKNEFYDLGFDLQYHFATIRDDDVRGIIFVDPPISYEGIFPFMNIGYRRYSKKGIFRIGFAPGILNGDFILGAYVGYGFLLNKNH